MSTRQPVSSRRLLGALLALSCSWVACAAPLSPGPPPDWAIERQLGWWLDVYESSRDVTAEDVEPAAKDAWDADADEQELEALSDSETAAEDSGRELADGEEEGAEEEDQGDAEQTRLASARERRLSEPRSDLPELDLAEIRRGLARLAQLAPRETEVLVANGLLAWRHGDRVAAARWLDDALDLDPGHVQAAVARASLAVRDGNLDFAQSRLEQAVVLRPDAPRLREALAGVAYFRGEFAEAEDQLALAEELHGTPTAARAYHRGLVAEALGERERAAAFYDLALALEPDHASAGSRRIGLRVLN